MRMSEPKLFLEIAGCVPSKKNAWKRRASGGMYLPTDVKDQIEAIEWQIVSQRNKQRLRKALEGAIRIDFTLWTADLKKDLDGVYTTFQDCLQKTGIIKNDRQVYDFHPLRIQRKGEDKIVALIYEDE